MSGPMWMPRQPPTLSRLVAWRPQPIPVLPLISLALLVLYTWGVVVPPLRALPTGHGRRGHVRRGVLRLLHSRALGVVTHPAVTFVLFIMSLYGLYYTPLFDDLMGTWWGHDLMLVHFLVIAFLHFWGSSASTPTHGPRSMPSPMVSVLEVAATAPFHAFFGVAVMMSSALLVRFYAMPLPGRHVVPLTDQGTGGGIEPSAYHAYLQTLARTDEAQQ